MAVTDRKIRVLQLSLLTTGNTGVRFESGAGGTALTGVMTVVGAATAAISGVNGLLLLPYSPVGWFETAAGALLNLELSGAGSASGMLVYREV